MNTAGWPTETIEACLDRVTVRSALKLQTKDYRSSGAIPIVDQGQALIAGWTDDTAGLISEPLPLIVFGDHTRAFKFIDFPFIRGADGTQLLKPQNGIDPLFFYFACQAIDLPSRGYNRHFTILKQKEISLPPREEQTLIARALRWVQSGFDLQQTQAGVSEQLKRAAMREVFTCGLGGEVQKETEIGVVLESWELIPIRRLGQIVTGSTPPTKDPVYYFEGTVPFVTPGDFEHGSPVTDTAKRISPAGLSVSRPLPVDTTCFVCIGSTIGKVGLTTAPISTSNQQINAIIPRAEYDHKYVFYLMTWWSDHIRKQASPSPVPILSKGAFEQINLYASPDIAEQRQIVAILEAIDRKIDLHKRKKTLLEELFRTLLHKLMTGEIRVADLDLSALGDRTLGAEAAA